tara:strand:+ start:318 stop:2183 length:1866 start_codon:yes stop_codon:yes gene_type:complete
VFYLFVIGTAGHVDHGKSSLVQRLTGIDPDRFKEEKQRGMTIDLGFAWFGLPNGDEVSVIDVPGHEKFVNNMLAGVGGIDLALIVISAEESVMPQTREHLQILNLLGVNRGIVALTKTDLVESDWVELVKSEVIEELSGTSLKNADIVPVSSVTGFGIIDLVSVIETEIESTEPKVDLGRPRLPIDRSFTISGFGTVVTGTLVEGQLKVGQEIELYPSGLKGRIRGLQSHTNKEDVVFPGTRVAANISGIDHSDIKRGDVLSLPSLLISSEAFDVRLQVLDDCPYDLKHDSNVTLYTGSREVGARLRLLEGNSVSKGDSTWAQIKPTYPIPVLKGDFFVIRSNTETLGGGVVVDIQSRRHKRRSLSIIKKLEILKDGSLGEILLNMIEANQPLEFSSLENSLLLSRTELSNAITELVTKDKLFITENDIERGYIFTKLGWESTNMKIMETLTGFHSEFPLREGIQREDLRIQVSLDIGPFNHVVSELSKSNLLVENGSVITSVNHEVVLDDKSKLESADFINKLSVSPFSPPTDSVLHEDVVNYLTNRGEVVNVGQGIVFLASAFDEMLLYVKFTIEDKGEVTVGDVRTRFDTSRKYVLAFMEYLDQQQITRRVGDSRILR